MIVVLQVQHILILIDTGEGRPFNQYASPPQRSADANAIHHFLLRSLLSFCISPNSCPWIWVAEIGPGDRRRQCESGEMAIGNPQQRLR